MYLNKGGQHIFFKHVLCIGLVTVLLKKGAHEIIFVLLLFVLLVLFKIKS